jgi:hypothetical protein
MWALYLAYEKEMHLADPFSPTHELDTKLPRPAPPTVEVLLTQIGQLGQQAQGLPMNQLVELAAAMLPHVGQNRPLLKVDGMFGAFCESEHVGYAFKTDLTLERVMIAGQEGTRQEYRWQRWEEQEP